MHLTVYYTVYYTRKDRLSVTDITVTEQEIAAIVQVGGWLW